MVDEYPGGRGQVKAVQMEVFSVSYRDVLMEMSPYFLHGGEARHDSGLANQASTLVLGWIELDEASPRADINERQYSGRQEYFLSYNKVRLQA